MQLEDKYWPERVGALQSGNREVLEQASLESLQLYCWEYLQNDTITKEVIELLDAILEKKMEVEG